MDRRSDAVCQQPLPPLRARAPAVVRAAVRISIMRLRARLTAWMVRLRPMARHRRSRGRRPSAFRVVIRVERERSSGDRNKERSTARCAPTHQIVSSQCHVMQVAIVLGIVLGPRAAGTCSAENHPQSCPLLFRALCSWTFCFGRAMKAGPVLAHPGRSFRAALADRQSSDRAESVERTAAHSLTSSAVRGSPARSSEACRRGAAPTNAMTTTYDPTSCRRMRM